MAHAPAKPPATAPRQGFSTGRPVQLMVKPDDGGGFMAIAGATGFATAEAAKGWLDKLAELMVDVDATHKAPSDRRS